MAVRDGLERMHGWRTWHWWPDSDPFEVIVGSILVQNTAWANVERALDRLRAADVISVAAMSAVTVEQIEELVRPSGQFRQKAKKLVAFLSLVNEHGGLKALLALDPAELRIRLLATWGIGPETADCIVLYAARQPASIADAYFVRLCSRLGIGPVGSRDYHAWQRFATESLPPDRDILARFHSEVVLHCKFLCRKRSPKCDECSFFPACPASPMRLLGGVADG
jgi:endonuclease III related protein